MTRRATWAERAEPLTRNPGRTAAIALGGMLLVAVAARLWLSRQIVTPWIMIDELLYSEMAKSFASSGDFLVRDAPTSLNNVVYPALISPAWLAHPMGTTYGLAKAINVVLMTATGIPLYLWARRLVAPAFALLAVVLTLLMPSFIYTGMLMTENAFLPAFVLATFAMALGLERPTLLRQVATFAAIFLALAIRYQGLVLLLVLPLAIVLKAVFELRAESRPRPWRSIWLELHRYWFSFALLAGGALLYVGLQAARGHTLSGALGSYQAVAGHGYSLGEVRHWTLLHFAEFAFSVGMLPASALLLLVGLAFVRGGTRSPAERAFLAVTAAAVPLIVIEVAAFASRFSLRIEDRYMFFLGPLLFLAFALWLDRGIPRPAGLAVAAGVIPAALLLAIPFASLLNVSIYSDTFGLIPVLRLSTLVSGVSEARRVLLIGGFAAAAIFVLWPRRAWPQLVLPGAVAAFLVLSSYPVVGALRDYSRNLRATAGLQEGPSWIDARLGGGAKASFLLGTTNDTWPETLSLWQQEFWNRQLGPVYNLSTPEPAGGPETPVGVAPQTGLVVSKLTGQAVTAPYVVSNLSFVLDGRLIAERPPFGLYRTNGPLRVAESRAGIYADGWMGADASYTRFVSRRPGQLIVALSRKIWTGPDKRVHARVQLIPLRGPRAGQAVVTRSATLSGHGSHAFALRTPKAPFTITIHIEPTFSPAQFGLSDTRQLGAQVGFSPR
jgi:hypothetical protein